MICRCFIDLLLCKTPHMRHSIPGTPELCSQYFGDKFKHLCHNLSYLMHPFSFAVIERIHLNYTIPHVCHNFGTLMALFIYRFSGISCFYVARKLSSMVPWFNVIQFNSKNL